jgi:hypothetical protein
MSMCDAFQARAGRPSARAILRCLGYSATIAIAASASAATLVPPEQRECPMQIDHRAWHEVEWCFFKPEQKLSNGSFATCKEMVDYANAWHAHCDPKHRPFVETWDQFTQRIAREEAKP